MNKRKKYMSKPIKDKKIADFFRVRAIDHSGNAGTFSSASRAVPQTADVVKAKRGKT